jgi:hypothetical protein
MLEAFIKYGTAWEQSGLFPRISLCDFRIRMPGQNLDVDFTVQCLLMANYVRFWMLYSIFTFLWFSWTRKSSWSSTICSRSCPFWPSSIWSGGFGFCSVLQPTMCAKWSNWVPCKFIPIRKCQKNLGHRKMRWIHLNGPRIQRRIPMIGMRRRCTLANSLRRHPIINECLRPSPMRLRTHCWVPARQPRLIWAQWWRNRNNLGQKMDRTRIKKCRQISISSQFYSPFFVGRMKTIRLAHRIRRINKKWKSTLWKNGKWIFLMLKKSAKNSADYIINTRVSFWANGIKYISYLRRIPANFGQRWNFGIQVIFQENFIQSKSIFQAWSASMPVITWPALSSAECSAISSNPRRRMRTKKTWICLQFEMKKNAMWNSEFADAILIFSVTVFLSAFHLIFKYLFLALYILIISLTSLPIYLTIFFYKLWIFPVPCWIQFLIPKPEPNPDPNSSIFHSSPFLIFLIRF